jgi:DnaK suppressor protein
VQWYDDHGGAAMKKKELEFFRKMLNRQLAELTQKSDADIAELLRSVVHSTDPVDQAEMELERNYAIRMLDRENKLILKVKKALERIEDHTFGICQGCGQKIDFERLKSRPVAEFCIGCKTRQEKLKKFACEQL